MNSGAPERWAVPAPLVGPVVFKLWGDDKIYGGMPKICKDSSEKEMICLHILV